MKNTSLKSVVLAYSGGLDTSAIIPWLKEYYQLEVIAFVANIGQSKKDLKDIEKKAILSGALNCYVLDLRKKFVEEYIYPVLRTGAIYEGSYLLGTAMARPIIAKAQVELATELKAIAVCHGSTGKGNDQVRFESVYAALAPNLKVIAPWREWKMKSRQDLLEYLKSKNVPSSATLEKIYSRDENIWHTSTEGGKLENPWNVTDENCWVRTVDPMKAPENSEHITLEIKKGSVISIDKHNLGPLGCIKKLNKIGSRHGIGRLDIVENRLVGIKSRGCYETPGGTIIVKAIEALEQLVLDRDSLKWRHQIGLEMSYVVYDGRWFTPLRSALQKSADSLSELVNGTVVLNLYKGSVTVIQKKSPNSLYSEEFATFNEDKVYNHNDAKGFIRLFSLSSRIRAIQKEKNNS